MVAITGATGLLGGHIIDRLLAEGVRPIVLHRAGNDRPLPAHVSKKEGDILDQVSLREAFEGATTVIHSAAFVSFNPRRRKKIFEVNVGGTRNVVDTCLQLGIKNFIHISSVAALGDTPGEEITEESKLTTTRSTDYAESKYLAELEVFRGAEEGLTISIVNPSFILSASQPNRSSATLFNYVWNERPYYTEGSLNYVDARDVADAVYLLYKKPQAGEKFILSAGNLSYREFFALVAKRFNKRAPSIKIGSTLSYWAGLAEELRGLLSNSEPLVTRQSAGVAIHSFHYSNKKAQQIGISFRPLNETIRWCCEDFLGNANTNK